jgi:hypothetical protein
MSDEMDKLERYAYIFFKAGGMVTLTEWMSMSEDQMKAFLSAKARADGFVTKLDDTEAASTLAALAEESRLQPA